MNHWAALDTLKGEIESVLVGSEFWETDSEGWRRTLKVREATDALLRIVEAEVLRQHG